MATNPDSLNRFSPEGRGLEAKRCSRCGVRKALWAFYRERSCRGGRRPECKRCHARWRRSRYRPKTGRRNRTRADRWEARRGASGPGATTGRA